MYLKKNIKKKRLGDLASAKAGDFFHSEFKEELRAKR
uniref:Uncharacterized protein n=1 Tax=Anguilla anguilla TaxID=7936 RepID=A0A0E9U3U3_ANGAN